MISLLAAALLADAAFVQADVVRVRSRPDSQSPVVARLRIGTEVEVVEKSDAWSRVETPAGWIATTMLAATPPTLDSLQERLAHAKGPERLAVLERLAALDPASRERQEALAAAYRDAGQETRARAVERRLAGGEAVYVAPCIERTRMVIARLEENAMVDLRDHGKQGAALERLAAEVGGLPWYRASGAETSLVTVRSPDVRAFGFGAVVLEPASAEVPAEWRVVSLGPCDPADDIPWVSAPATRGFPGADPLRVGNSEVYGWLVLQSGRKVASARYSDADPAAEAALEDGKSTGAGGGTRVMVLSTGNALLHAVDVETHAGGA